MLSIELISIGNELLLGIVLDTNSHWLCQQLTAMGGQVRRMVQVRDEIEAIAREVRGAVERGSDMLLTCGGLGPTDDDITLRAVAAALLRPLEEHPEALTMLEQCYRKLAQRGHIATATLTPARRKMALLPQGARPLFNPAGSAPGVLLQEEETTIICLPGVPEEMKRIFSESLSTLWKERFAGYTYAERSVSIHGMGESALAPLLRQIRARHPTVYVKSRAQHFDPAAGGKPHVHITLSLAGTEQVAVAAGLQATLEDLQATLAEAGIAVEAVERENLTARA